MPSDGFVFSGKVTMLKVGTDWCHFQVDSQYLVLWGPSDPRPLSSFEWFSLLREALANDLDVQVVTTDYPISIVTITLLPAA
jgi:hypothetical protein